MSTENMLISLDVSTTCTGIAAFTNYKDSVNFKLSDYNYYNLKNIDEMAWKIKTISQGLYGLKQYWIYSSCNPDLEFQVVREDNFIGPNPQTSLMITAFNGVIDKMCLEIFDCIPIKINNQQVKYNTLKLKCGSKVSSTVLKKEIVRRVNELFGLNLKNNQHDIADAIGIGYHYILNQEVR